MTDTATRRRLYFVWRKMVARCHDPADSAYARYGQRGIAVDPAWRGSFVAFLADMLPGYAPGLLDRGFEWDEYTEDGPLSDLVKRAEASNG